MTLLHSGQDTFKSFQDFLICHLWILLRPSELMKHCIYCLTNKMNESMNINKTDHNPRSFLFIHVPCSSVVDTSFHQWVTFLPNNTCTHYISTYEARPVDHRLSWLLLINQSLQLVSPQVYVFPRKQTVPEGNATTISCKATAGTPKPTFTWKFEERDLPSVANVSTTEEGSLLHLSNTTKGMGGIYKCTATNKADNATSNATVHVLGNDIVFYQ